MFTEYIDLQYRLYREATDFFSAHPERLIETEHFVMDEILHFIRLKLPELVRDYNEASYLYPFWKNEAPLDRGKNPKGDQYPWIEVGERVFGNKLARYFGSNFTIKDSGLPSGSDDRCVISSETIKSLLGLTDSAWVFIDIKSDGPRDDFNHAVMSPYQISGSGEWKRKEMGVKNSPIKAAGKRCAHDFFCSLSPVYVLSDGTIAPLCTFAIKPIYGMIMENGVNTG